MSLHTKLSDPHRPFRDRDFAKVLAIVIVGICFLIAFAIYADAQELEGQGDGSTSRRLSTVAALRDEHPATAERRDSPAARPAPSRFITPLAIGFAGLAAGDVITTRLALRNPALVEGNPLYRGSALRMGLIKGGATAGLLMTALSVRHTHPKAALWMLVGFTAGQIVADAHNWRIAR